MKYTVKIKINKQVDVNEGKKDKDNNPLPQKLETLNTFTTVTDVLASGDTKFTVAEIKSELQVMYPVTPSIDEKLSADGVELTNGGDEVSSRKLEYSITKPYVTPDSAQ